jgi:8-oxo-dGTP pyrophosphatase MutT (NUDIX family)
MSGCDEVVVAVVRGRDFLILLRAPHKHAYWHLVSGRVEPGETDAEAAARELYEETELEAATLDDLGDDLAYDGIRVHAFATRAPNGWEPTLNDEHDDYRWCSVEDALALLRYEEPREAVRRAVRRPGPSP